MKTTYTKTWSVLLCFLHDINNASMVVYVHVGLFKQDVQLAVQNQIGISKRVIVDQIIQL